MTNQVVAFNLANLVNSSLLNGNPYADLVDVLANSRTRTWKERKALKAKIKAYEFSGAVIDVRNMFSLPQAWKVVDRKDGYGSAATPRVGMAVIKQTSANFSAQSTGFYDDSVRSTKIQAARRILVPVHSQFPWRYTLHASVPFIPKKHVPYFPREKHIVMFDVENWSKREIPMDPYILERVDQHKFKVLSHWDLTEAERRLMALAAE